MNWDTIQQLLRIIAYALGGFFLGEAVTNGQQFQAAVAGLISVGAFAWWWFWERQRA